MAGNNLGFPEIWLEILFLTQHCNMNREMAQIASLQEGGFPAKDLETDKE
jgi:hypothetical protein